MKKLIYPLIIILLAILCYLPGVNGSFLHDDYPNIVENKSLHIDKLSVDNLTNAATSSSSGPLKRPISMLTFSINHYFDGLNPHAYKATNIAIHLLNSILIYIVCLFLIDNLKSKEYSIDNHTLAFLIALAWCVHPINVSTVLYIVQRMTMLSAFFVLLSLLCYLVARNRLKSDNHKAGLSYLAATIISAGAGILCKENAALVFVYLFLIECALSYKKDITNTHRRILSVYFFIFLFLPCIIVTGYTMSHPDWILDGYNLLPVTLRERILTEPRIIWTYIYWIILPNNKNFGLFHDDISVSESLFDPTITLLSIIGHLVFITILYLLYKKRRLVLPVLGFGIFYASHLLESTALPLMLLFEHRNYFGSFGILLALFSSLFVINRQYTKYSIIFSIGFIALLTSQTTLRSIVWADTRHFAQVNVINHPNSSEAHYKLGHEYYARNTIEYRKKAIDEFLLASDINKQNPSPLFAILSLSSSNKQSSIEINDILTKLDDRLRNGPVLASNIAWMNRLTNCYIDKICVFDKNNIDVIFDAILSNKKLEKATLYKSYLLMMRARVEATSGNYSKALELAESSSQTSPDDIRFLINIYHLALTYSDYSTASKAIASMKKISPIKYKNEIATLEQNLIKSMDKQPTYNGIS